MGVGFPILNAAIQASGLQQWRVAILAGLRETRLSRIVRHGGATREEREVLVRLLGVPEDELFGPGPTVSLNVGPVDSGTAVLVGAGGRAS